MTPLTLTPDTEKLLQILLKRGFASTPEHVLKKAFSLAIDITDIMEAEEEQDETEYLLRSPENKRRLLHSIREGKCQERTLLEV